MKRNKLVYFILFALLFFGGIFCVSAEVSAATVNYYVDPTGTDDGSHGTGTGTDAWATIEYAVNAVSNPTSDTIIINIAAGTYITNNNVITIDRNFVDLTLQGAGANSTIVKPHTTASSATVQNFYIGYSEDVIFRDMTIQDGVDYSGGPAIEMWGDTLGIYNCYIYDNDSSNGSGGVWAARGVTTIEGSTFAYNDGDTSGAFNGYTYSYVTNSTFYENTSDNGHLNVSCGYNLIVTNITVLGGNYGIGNNCSSATLYIKNSIVANTQYTGIDFDGRPIHNGGYNIIESHDAGSTFDSDATSITGNQTSLNLIEYLSTNNNSDNETLTLALTSGSVAIDAGDSVAHGPEGYEVTPPSTDQRGKSRYNVTYDIGAFEYQGVDEADPYFTNASISDADNYIDITFNEEVYSTSGGSGALDASDFTIDVTTGYGEVSAATVTNVKKLDNTNPAGGETQLRLYISLTGTKRGVEQLEVYPANSTSIYDAAGNPMSTSISTDAVTLSGQYEYYVDPTGTDDGSHGTASGTDAWATIQYAIDNVSNPAYVPIIIHIAAGTYTNTDDATLTDDHIEINRGFTDLTLRGAGANNTTIKPHATATSSASRVFYIYSEGDITLEDMTIQDGQYYSTGPAIYSDRLDSLTLRGLYIYDNDSSGSSTSGKGGVYSYADVTTVENCTFDSNNGSYVSAMSSADGYTYITNSTFVDNSSSSWGQVSNSCGNTQILTNVTIMGGQGGVGNYCSTAITYLKNSVIYNSTGTGVDMDGRPFYSGGYNIVKNHDTGTKLTGDGSSLIGEQASLYISSSLADNSSTTGPKTLAITSTDSVAYNSGDTAAHGPAGYTVTPSVLDQRGGSRVGAIDIGAFELYGVIGGPYVTEYYPADDATSIAVDSNLFLTFSENVDAETGNIYLYKSDDTLVETFDVTADISGSGTTTITINPTSNLDSGTEYYLRIDATAFDDADSNSYNGISDEVTWTFTTADTTAPTITSISSDTAGGTYIVGQTIDIDVTFSEAVTSTGNVTVTLETGDTDRTCTFTVSNSTTGTCDYTVQSGDVSGDLDATITGTISDQADNSLINYTPSTGLAANEALVIAGVVPEVATLSPADDEESIGLTADLVITFTEAVDAESGNITLYKSDATEIEAFDVTTDISGSGTTTITIDPTSNLTGSTEYYVQIDASAFDDADGNSFAGITDTTTWTFETGVGAARSNLLPNPWIVVSTPDEEDDNSDNGNQEGQDEEESDSEEGETEESNDNESESSDNEGEQSSEPTITQNSELRLVRLPNDSAVYQVNEDGTRSPYLNEEHFMEYFDNFATVEVISQSEMDELSFEDPVPFKVGQLVKFLTVSKIYKVGENNELNWIPTESLFFSLGYSFDMVDLLFDSLFPIFTIGDDLE